MSKEEVSKEQIEKWKEDHGGVFCLEVDGHKCYLKKPSRKVLSMAMTTSKNDPIKFGETMLKNCWLGGDESIKTDDDLFFGAMQQLDQMMEFKEAEIKKL
jgi:hypothetical protein